MGTRYIGVDLRELTRQEGNGAGIAHVSKELWDALNRNAQDIDIVCLPLRTRNDFARNMQGVLFPTGAVPIWFQGVAFPLVHDLFIFDHPEWFDQNVFQRAWTTNVFLRGLRRARHIFAVSEYTRQDIIRHAKIALDRITVTYQGTDVGPSEIPPKENHAENIFLALGTVEPRKNLGMLFALIQRGDFPKNAKLIVAGKKGWGGIQVPAHRQIVYAGEVSEEEKRRLLRRATALVLPSFSEGFGRTALEAMSMGTPVIASRAGALREVVGEAGILLDPLDVSAWKEAIADLSKNPIKCGELSERGRTQAKKFSWEYTSREILATIKSSC